MLIEWPLSDAPTSIRVFFFLLLLYLISVACIYVEISLGSSLHKDDCMGQRATLNHNVQLSISLNNQYAIIQWSLLDASTSIHGVFTTLSLSTVYYDYYVENSMGSRWRKDILRVKGLP